MDKINKFLRSINRLEALKFSKIIRDIRSPNLDMYDVKKLKGQHNNYRVRIGKVRIIFSRRNGRGIIEDIDFRGSIYKK